MADEQGTGLGDGYFARKKLGRIVNGLLDQIGPNGRRYPPQDAPPAGAEVGDSYLADGTNWDPAGTGNAAFVQYDGAAWQVVHEHV
jgi:hypothetical protein